ncbi:hypothetical protein Rhopal_001337-T1 [Rhodotorula paludigena]|uniref:F-box domain-containing protein n=1 Tax=Rhodotorula paludigena TaxID=86838 RepID=A0AAV5G749_9BASI|nr:hypothetical protein Rhopal_001337-T1 [Rhodotorula paludigena]
MPAEVVALVISFFSPSHLDPLEASDERITFYVTCMLVNKAWAAAARRCLHADLLIEHPSHPLLRTNDLVDPKHSLAATASISGVFLAQALRSLSLHLCNVSWAYFPTDRIFPLLQSLSFTHVESFPSSHLEQFILPSLGTLTLCTGALTELLTRPHRTLSRAYELVRSAPALRIVEGADGESPPVWTGWRSRSFPFAGELSLAHSRSTGLQASFSRRFTSPDTRQDHRGSAAPGSRESHLTASVRWMFAPWAQLAPLLRARASFLELLTAHLLSSSAMTNSVLEELILPFSWADPGTPLSARFRTAAEPTEVQLLRESGVRVTFEEAGAEERGRMERAKGWVGSV